MKKNISRITVAVCALLIASACSTSWLEVQPKGASLESNYYQTADQVFSGLVGIYAATAQETSAAINWYSSKIAPLNCAADECWAGGGGANDNASWQAWNKYTLTSANSPADGYWSIDYQGIYRANLLLVKIEGNIPDLTAPVKARYIAETKYLRAYFYFELIRLFKNIPLILTAVEQSDWYNIKQADPADVWAQIEQDLNDAIPNLPSTVTSSESGRVTKGAGYALLGKVLLFEGSEYWNGGSANTAKMGAAADALAQVRTSGLYSLLPNFGDIFDPGNKFNSESVYEIVHSNQKQAQWGQDPFSGNLYPTLVGPRTYTGPLYLSGWSFNPIIPDFAHSMNTDPRFDYTVLNIDGDRDNDGTKDGLVQTDGAAYVAGYDNTGFFIQKFAPLTAWKAVAGEYVLNFPNDYIEIRYADVLLMEAEALVRVNGDGDGQAQANLDEVRARVGLGSVTATLANILEERRLELATEGHRWYDLVRTGRAASVLAFKGFEADKHELLPIPLVDMNNTKLVQNHNY